MSSGSQIISSLSSQPFHVLEESLSSSSVEEYLKTAKSTYDANIDRTSAIFHIVMGNEAADLDSISAAILRARYLSLKSMNSVDFFCPVINIPRKEWALRSDAASLFEQLKVDSASLIFADEVPFERLAKQQRLRLHLVDHNVLALHQSQFVNHVFSIVDHHKDELISYPNCPKERKSVQTVGSATTLVANTVLKSEYSGYLDGSWKPLILAPILLDTDNLTSKQKTTNSDVQLVRKLTSSINSNSLRIFFEYLYQTKSNTDGLTPDMLLRKDLKHYQEGKIVYSISSLPKGTEYPLDQNSEFLAALKAFRESQSVSIAMVMGHSSHAPQRFLHMYFECPKLFERLLRYFGTDEELSKIFRLEKKEIPQQTVTWILDGRISRKVLQPRLNLGGLL